MNTELTILEDDPDDAAGDDKADEGLHHNSDIPEASSGPLRQAAVLVPLIYHNANWHIQFIRRAANQADRHSGQVAFPGGRQEPEDASPEITALREAEEEIGLPSASVRILGRLADYRTISNYAVTPVVGIVDQTFTPVLQASEVARAFTIPLDWLRQRSNFTRRARANMDPASARRHPVIVYEDYDGEVLWGATARMTLNCLRAINDGEIVLTTHSAHSVSKH